MSSSIDYKITALKVRPSTTVSPLSVDPTTSTTNGNIYEFKHVELQNKYELPNIGKEKTLYIILSESSLYIWSSLELSYHKVGSDWNDIETIDGGNASDEE